MYSFESPFTSVSTVSKGHPSLVSFSFQIFATLQIFVLENISGDKIKSFISQIFKHGLRISSKSIVVLEIIPIFSMKWQSVTKPYFLRLIHK
jgi:hypothetical protein